MAEGQVHEAMNLAGVMNLPVVFICENNQNGDTTPAEDQHHVGGFESRGETYGMPTETVDGISAQDVYEATTEATARARNGDGPSLLVCETYRCRGHHEADPMTYRTEGGRRVAGTGPHRYARAFATRCRTSRSG